MTEKRLAVVTGAAAGLGLAIAQGLADPSRRLVLLDRSPSVHDVAKSIDGAEGHVCDLEDLQAAEAFCVLMHSRHGRCDILVNNAGVHPKEPDGAKLSVDRMSMDTWHSTLAINLTAPFFLAKQLMPLMREKGWGRIVNMSSRGGRTHIPGCGAHYAATKAAIVGLTRILAEEGAPHGITANAVAPGRISTPMSNTTTAANMARSLAAIPLGRAGEPQELAAAVAFLASDAASYITGAVLDVNGGSFMP
jgi:3-oxoacyl-[acyl-carrier protein] reductase